MLVFGSVKMSVPMTLTVAFLIGVTLQGGYNGIWPLAASVYPAERRATGIGWAIGIGRSGAVIGPLDRRLPDGGEHAAADPVCRVLRAAGDVRAGGPDGQAVARCGRRENRMKSRIVSLLAAIGLRPMAACAHPVATEGGLVEGITLESGVRAWLGVPFAAPPVRELRWRAPQPMPEWNGVLHAERAAPMCLQALRIADDEPLLRQRGHQRGLPVPEHLVARPVRTDLPVIVWIYGGGFNVGSASMANYSGARTGAGRRGAREPRLPRGRAGLLRASGADA